MKSIFLDSGPLSLVAQRKGKAEADRCKAWLQRMIAAGWQVVVPSITDYEVRREGRPTSDPLALNGDVILAAQALSVGTASDDVVVATTNVGHIARFVAASLWTEIEP